jgi:ubiquinone/menaquinone biosynthesis C-methylase UbiE
MKKDRNRVCPVELADSLDSRLRRWLQNPLNILAPYVYEGMTALDVGCGPGFFAIEMAKIVGNNGRVVAADLQEGMLTKLSDKIRGTDLERRILPVKCDRDSINVSEKVDFILAFYVIHEIPDKSRFFDQLKHILKENGQVLVVEPRLFHVSRKAFEVTLGLARKSEFTVTPGPGLWFSWSAVLRHN